MMGSVVWSVSVFTAPLDEERVDWFCFFDGRVDEMGALRLEAGFLDDAVGLDLERVVTIMKIMSRTCELEMSTLSNNCSLDKADLTGG
jgi:hypothetical protein